MIHRGRFPVGVVTTTTTARYQARWNRGVGVVVTVMLKAPGRLPDRGDNPAITSGGERQDRRW